MEKKLETNADHFPNPADKMAYVYYCIGEDTQTHLHSHYSKELVNPFHSIEEMIEYLAGIYVDPFKAQNTWFDYRNLMMKTTKTFSSFNSRFLQLVGKAYIPAEDLVLDLFDKLTIDLQRVVLSTYASIKSLKDLIDYCLALD